MGVGETFVMDPEQLENFAPRVQSLSNRAACNSSVSGFPFIPVLSLTFKCWYQQQGHG